jgi:hypothetical protein
MAARGASAAASGASHRVHECRHTRRECGSGSRIPARSTLNQLYREAERRDRILLGGWSARSSTTATTGIIIRPDRRVPSAAISPLRASRSTPVQKSRPASYSALHGEHNGHSAGLCRRETGRCWKFHATLLYRILPPLPIPNHHKPKRPRQRNLQTQALLGGSNRCDYRQSAAFGCG